MKKSRTYQTAAAFRTALEDRLAKIAVAEHVDLQRLRRQVAFDRLGNLENARIPIQIDLGFGDVITPAPVEIEIPLDLTPSKLLIYPRDSVVAEEFEALVSLGIANSRMKDLQPDLT